jgi:hypothetical protein
LSCACASDTHTSEIGQEIYYATHQFFLSERSLFLVVFNLLSLVQSRVEYWYEPLLQVLFFPPFINSDAGAGCNR